MLSLDPVRKRFGDYICRSCLNKEYSVNLNKEDCRYGYFGYCPSCKEPRNIVVGFEPSGKVKMLLK